MLASGCESCLKRVPAESVERLPYPTCDGERLPAGEVIASGVLVDGPAALEEQTEWWELRRRGCVYVYTIRQDWQLNQTEFEAIFDLDWNPLRAWKRMRLPGPAHPDDIRLYEMRADPATMVWAGEEGEQAFWFRNGAPDALVGPGRAILGAWIRRADLAVDQIDRRTTLDARRTVERVAQVALRREQDLDVEGLGRVRAYTVFGRETVFADDEGNVIGDLSGLRDAARIGRSVPPPSEPETPPDPMNTP